MVGRTLAGRILVAVLGIVIATMAIGVWLYSRATANLTDQHAQEQARSIAVSVAAIPDVAEELVSGDPNHLLPGLAERIRVDAGAAYVVVIDRTGIRYSHPNPALIGQRVEEPVVALDGQVHSGVDEGSLGRSANVKAPIVDAAGSPVGEVSVGILETEIGSRFTQQMTAVALYSAIALALGVIASLVLARTLKRVTFGLEPAEIVALVQEREAMLHGIREGVVGIDARGRINVLNGEARRLLQPATVQLGQPIADALPPGHLRDILDGTVTGPDQVAVTDDHLLVVNRMPVQVGDHSAGWVVTIRDRTEMEGLIRQLDSVSALTGTLRAQEHEFANRLHVLSTLLELGETTEAITYSRRLQEQTTLMAEQVRERVASPVLAALVLSKIALAAERDVRLVLDPASRLTVDGVDAMLLVTILGNLIDNAVDAVAGDPGTVTRTPRGAVTVFLGQNVSPTTSTIRLQVRDTGPGIPAGQVSQLFVDGYTTKPAKAGLHRGIGLALVHRLVSRAGGHIDVSGGDGASFTVTLPVPPPPLPVPSGPDGTNDVLEAVETAP